MRLILAILMLILEGQALANYVSDIDQFIRDTESTKAVHVPLALNLESEKIVDYDPKNLRDPFSELQSSPANNETVYKKKQEPKNSVAKNGPDLSKPKQVLENFSLSDLKYVGYIQSKDHFFALISDPRGVVHRVGVDDFIGTDHGKIKTIDPQIIQIVESVLSPDNGWEQRISFLKTN